MLSRTYILVFLSPLLLQAEISFNKDVRPILSAKCIVCHGPDDGVDAKGKANRKAGLRLDTPEGAYREKDGITAIVPNSLEDSEAWVRITSKDDPMPPVDGHAKPLTSDEKELLKNWIQEGAEYEDFWAFVPAKKQEVPAITNDSWPLSDTDKFVLAKIEAKGKSPNKKADNRTLIRRLSLDLTGLPPTLEEIGQFLTDTSPNAYQNLVDRLLTKPAYGEHMAKLSCTIFPNRLLPAKGSSRVQRRGSEDKYTNWTAANSTETLLQSKTTHQHVTYTYLLLRCVPHIIAANGF